MQRLAIPDDYFAPLEGKIKSPEKTERNDAVCYSSNDLSNVWSCSTVTNGKEMR